MYKHYTAYRFKNGEVMGFIGEGLSRQNAEINSHNRIIAKLQQLEESFTKSRVINSMDNLSIEETKLIKSDWDKIKDCTF